jgi:hypothetical protein
MKRISFFGLVAFATIMADVGPAKAALDYSIYESLGNLVIQVSGSLNLPAPATGNGICSQEGAIVPFFQSFCTGPAASNLKRYNLATGPNSFMGGSSIAPASSVSGETMMFWAANPVYAMFLPNAYVSGAPIVSGAIFNGKTLADIGLTPSSGTLGTWTLTGTGDTITLKVGQPVPGPLPVLGAGVAFGVSRRLRRRIQSGRLGVSA